MDIINFKKLKQDFPGGAVVKNPAANVGDTGSIPGQGTDPTRMLQLSVHIPQLRSLPAAAKEPASTTNTQHNQINK